MKAAEEEEEKEKWLLVSKDLVEVDDDLLFLFGELPSLDIRPQIVRPPQPATLPAPVQPGELRKRSPAPMPVRVYVISELLVLFRSPRPLLQPGLVAARRSPHLRHSCTTQK